MRTPLLASFGMAIVMALLTGCAGEPAGNSVSGEVVFQGKPLEQGTIEFSPAAGQATMSGGEIKDGHYSLPPENGLKPGAYDVRISSFQGGSGSSDELPGEAPPPPKQLIPAKYNTNTTLKAEVKDSGENKFDFNIP